MYDDDMQDEFSLRDAVKAISERLGLVATVEMTGGGCATIYVWRTSDDMHTDLPRVTAGPGTYYDMTGSSLEFYVGPDNYRYGDDVSGDLSLTMPEYIADPVEWLTSRVSLLMARTDYLTSIATTHEEC